ncbi:MAG: aminomethyl-transferring glycine dehydrogenase subunit GcvPB [bacterium]
MRINQEKGLNNLIDFFKTDNLTSNYIDNDLIVFLENGINNKSKLLNNEREDLIYPNLDELTIVRHFTNLSRKNWAIDVGIYPLGSCTMKYNPKINDYITKDKRILNLHPLLNYEKIQGILRILKELENYIKELVGMDEVSLLPAAGAHGEYTALLIAKKYFEKKYKDKNFKEIVLVPDSAHGTNPASATMANFKVKTIKSNEYGQIDLQDLENHIKENQNKIAVFMITNPNTLGIYEKNIEIITKICKENDILTYYDGANFNAIIGKIRPGDMGFDMLHLNLHKTFSTPHGSGGPGSGPVIVKSFLAPFLPIPRISSNKDNLLYLDFDYPDSIGLIRDFWGNILVLIRALSYILSYGNEINKVAENSVLNANYLKLKLKDYFIDVYKGFCCHEFVLSASNYKAKGIKAFDIAKRLLDYNVHPPTVYFPLIVEECLMIEPTETEDLQSLNNFIKAVENVVKEIENNPDNLREAPLTTPVKRINDALASRDPKPTIKSILTTQN